MKLKRIKIKVPIFDTNIEVIQASSLSTIEDYITDNFHCPIERVNGCPIASTFTISEYKTIIIGMTDWSDNSTLLHECCHAVFRIMDLNNISKEEDEVFCYTFEWLYQTIIDHINTENNE